jgi:hypothetical protein
MYSDLLIFFKGIYFQMLAAAVQSKNCLIKIELMLFSSDFIEIVKHAAICLASFFQNVLA